ncbi:MAG: 50S ribosomal protein L11 methyltransferase [Alphaproteobacteria bacterium]
MLKTEPTPSHYYLAQFLVPKDHGLIFSEILEDFFQSVSVSEEEETPHLWRVNGFSETAPDQKTIEKKISILSESLGMIVPEMQFKKEKNRNWVIENQAAFAPIEVGRFFIHGAHYMDPIPHAKTPLLIDANMAFGTGDHETTKGCILALEKIAKTFTPKTVLDMGCGTGILSMVAAKMWRVPVRAVDIDALSVKIATENALINKVDLFVEALVGDGYKTIGKEKYDIILSNIFARPLAKMSADLSAHLNKGGYAVLAGLLNAQAPMVISAHRRQGLRLVKKTVMGDWTILILRK